MKSLRSILLVLIALHPLACGSTSASDDSSSDAASGGDGTSGSDGSGGDGGLLVDGSRGDSAAADAAGDSASDGGAQPDASSFCPVPCDPSTSYCEGSYGPPSSDGGGAETFVCSPFHLPCEAGTPSCSCATVGPFCTCVDDAGAVAVTCPFHP